MSSLPILHRTNDLLQSLYQVIDPNATVTLQIKSLQIRLLLLTIICFFVVIWLVLTVLYGFYTFWKRTSHIYSNVESALLTKSQELTNISSPTYSSSGFNDKDKGFVKINPLLDDKMMNGNKEERRRSSMKD